MALFKEFGAVAYMKCDSSPTSKNMHVIMSTTAIFYMTVSSKSLSMALYEILQVNSPVNFIIQSFTEGLNALPISLSVEWVGGFVYSVGDGDKTQNSM